MQLTDEVHLVGSGLLGLSLTDEYDCNVYLVDGGGPLALVDTGAGYRPELVLEHIAAAGFDLERVAALILTHKHADHCGGTSELQRLTGASVYASAETAAAVSDEAAFNATLTRARNAGSYPRDYQFQGFTVSDLIASGDAIVVGELELTVIETPGHCAGHCAFTFRGSQGAYLFSGDALLPGGQVVLQPIPDCSVAETISSIELLDRVQADVLLPGHLAPVLRGGRRHVELAIARVQAGRLPDQVVIPSRRGVE